MDNGDQGKILSLSLSLPHTLSVVVWSSSAPFLLRYMKGASMHETYFTKFESGGLPSGLTQDNYVSWLIPM